MLLRRLCALWTLHFEQGVFTQTDRPLPDIVFTLVTSSAEHTKNVTMRRKVKKKSSKTLKIVKI